MGILRKNDDFLFYIESVARFLELRRAILHGPLCKDDTYILFFFEEEEEEKQHGPCMDDTYNLRSVVNDLQSICMAPVQG